MSLSEGDQRSVHSVAITTTASLPPSHSPATSGASALLSLPQAVSPSSSPYLFPSMSGNRSFVSARSMATAMAPGYSSAPGPSNLIPVGSVTSAVSPATAASFSSPTATSSVWPRLAASLSSTVPSSASFAVFPPPSLPSSRPSFPGHSGTVNFFDQQFGAAPSSLPSSALLPNYDFGAFPRLATPGVSSYPAFVVGPGFSPVASKLVASIVTGEFVELSQLLAPPSDTVDAPSFPLWEDRLVLRPHRKFKEITDIIAWTQAFTIYCLVLCTYHPHRATDLLQYKLLILRTHQQFRGSCWRTYDQSIRREPAALHLVDWSKMNPELFQFHAAAALGLSGSQPPTSGVNPGEARGSPQSPILCRSWNSGRCSSSFRVCRFRHTCDFRGCSELHRNSQAHDRPTQWSSPPGARFFPEPPNKRPR